MSDPSDDTGEPVYTLDNPPPRPWQTPEAVAEGAWQRMQARPHFSEALCGHWRPRFLERAPIRLYGMSGFGRYWYLYRDVQGERRALLAEDHDRAGIAALFEGAEGWLCRLWPAPDGGWDDERAAESLLHFQSCIGLVHAGALGFELPPEPLP